MANPSRADQAVVTEEAARLLSLHVGETVPVGFYTTAQMSSPGFGTAAVRPHARIGITVVGIVVLNGGVVQDDAERSISALVILTPALAARTASCCGAGDAEFGLQLDGGSSQVSTVETEVERLLPASAGFYVSVTSVTEAEAQQAIQPESVALGVFGGIAALAAVLIAGQAIGRQLRRGAAELSTLRALGAGPAMTVSDGLAGVLAAVVLGSLLAAAVAVGLSPLGPIGPVRPVYPGLGVAFDWTVLGFGALGLALVLSAVAVLFAYEQAPHRVSRRSERVNRSSRLERAGVASGLPVSALTGVRFALESSRRQDGAPMRSAIVGAAVAVSVVTGALTFGASLSTLISHPPLYGWNWSYELETPEGGGYIPGHEAAQLLGRDRDVAAWTGVYFDSLRVGGLTIPIIGGTPDAPVGPPILSGHTLQARNQIVLGAATLAELHKRVGDTVEANYGSISRRTPLRIVGTATMPAVGPGLGLHLSMGTGALVSDLLIPADIRNPTNGAPGPNAIFVRLRAGADPAAALRSLHQIDAALDSDPNAAPPVSTAGAAPGGYRQLPLHGKYPGSAGRCPGGRRRDSAGPHPDGLGPAPAARPGIAEDARLHKAPARCHRRLAIERRRLHRHRRGHHHRDRRRAPSVECVRPRNPRCAGTGRPGGGDRFPRLRGAPARQHRRRCSRASRGQDPARLAATSRMTSE